jgi:tripartite-type tricarboxylate transporter receptor subunit TctC
MFNMMAGVKLIAVAYRGGAPAMLDLLAGQVQVEFAPMSEAIGNIRAGKIRALGITSAVRSAALPDLPTVGDFLAGYEATAWYGVGAPKGTPAEIVDKLNHEINAGLADATIKERLADLGGAPLPLTAAEFSKLIADETEKWAKVIRAANVKPE